MDSQFALPLTTVLTHWNYPLCTAVQRDWAEWNCSHLLPKSRTGRHPYFRNRNENPTV